MEETSEVLYFAYFIFSNLDILLRKTNYWFCILFIFLFFFLFFSKDGKSQQMPKREMRAAWIATVNNIDWPSKPGLSSDVQKEEYIKLLDRLKDLGMNAVVVQIRPVADAFYPSAIAPWSYWLTGKQGKAPEPYYDPLKFMIKEAHKRGMEFHAWCNPYRAVFNTRKAYRISKGSPVKLHPDWMITYGSKEYFNPGLPQVRSFLVKVIKDIVKRYDVDAIHFDDYFYPYHIPGKRFPDEKAYKKYGNGLEKAAWRRHNVDTVIQMLSKAIKETKSWVKFGISPFGVWRNYSEDRPMGSKTHAGITNYDGLYADILLWLKKGWIDYVTPQLYWDFKLKAAPYGLLLKWWAKHTYGRQLYIGQSVYRIGQKGAWRQPDEMPRQIAANRTYKTVKGSMYFSASTFDRNPLGFNDSLRNHYYKYPAIPPRMPWIDSIPPLAPEPAGVLEDPKGPLIQWKDRDTTQQTTQFVIYRFPENVPPDRTNPKYILKIVNKKFSKNPRYVQSFLDTTAEEGKHYIYEITALDRLHNESGINGSLRAPSEKMKTPKAIYYGP